MLGGGCWRRRRCPVSGGRCRLPRGRRRQRDGERRCAARRVAQLDRWRQKLVVLLVVVARRGRRDGLLAQSTGEDLDPSPASRAARRRERVFGAALGGVRACVVWCVTCDNMSGGHNPLCDLSVRDANDPRWRNTPRSKPVCIRE